MMTEMMSGTIVKGIAGFYYVSIGKSLYECKARGIFRKDGITPHVGDLVRMAELDEEGKGVILEILPRKNAFIRPPVSNVDCFVVVMAAAKPKPNLYILDQFLVMAEEKQTDIIVCFNKCDIADEDELAKLVDTYENLYPVCRISAKAGDGVAELEMLIQGKKSALAGPSGAGKSTLLNAITGRTTMETGEVSRKTGRGKHTTRHAELFVVNEETMIFDTPGFTSFEILEAEEDELSHLFPEFTPYLGHCRYDDCRHLKEPGCIVIEEVECGTIHRSRYESYTSMLQQIREKRKY